jgi:hypothetical protein
VRHGSRSALLDGILDMWVVSPTLIRCICRCFDRRLSVALSVLSPTPLSVLSPTYVSVLSPTGICFLFALDRHELEQYLASFLVRLNSTPHAEQNAMPDLAFGLRGDGATASLNGVPSQRRKSWVGGCLW